MQETKSSNSKTVWIIVGVIVAILCCCLLILAGAGYWLYKNGDAIIEENLSIPDFSGQEPAEPLSVERPPLSEVSEDTLTRLEETVVPPNNLIEISCRLKELCGISQTFIDPNAPHQAGDTDSFWIANLDTDEFFKVEATLQYVTDHAYFWVEDGVSYKDKEARELIDFFENKIYPTDRAFFGSEWSPGVDGDEHIYILYAQGIGSHIAGYYSSADEYNPQAHKYSNAHEMFLFNADNTSLRDEFTYGVLAHEFQHMIHWKQDRNESSWLNEGFSELATFLNGLDLGGFDYVYTSQPDIQLNDWPNDSNATTPHYGASFLFTTYFLDRFGEEATQALVADPNNGLESVDLTLQKIPATDPKTGEIISADKLVLEWLVANYLNDPDAEDGQYAYHNYAELPKARVTAQVDDCPFEQNYSVHQYGGDYLQINCSGEYLIRFEGATKTGLLPVDPYSGKYAFWSNKGDESDMTLTREFDFSTLSGPITLTFRTWYDIEENYDYLYLEASVDGEHWQIITTPSGTDKDLSGNSYGWGYNGTTDGWIEESVDLSPYAGEKVQIRFEYVTDAAVNGEGMLIDDIRIDAIDYASDFETDNGGWEAEGFVRVQNLLPQTFQLALILQGSGEPQVEYLQVSDDQRAEIPVTLGGEYDRAILVVTGTTRFTREPANYSIEIK